MKTSTLLTMVCGVFLFSLGLATGLIASSGDSDQRLEKHRSDLSGAPGMEVIASTAEYLPGERLERHFHHGVEAAYVVQGASLRTAAGKTMQLPDGASVLNLREVEHGGFEVIGKQSLKLFTVHIVDKGKPIFVYSD